jgi:hypothetical protein
MKGTSGSILNMKAGCRFHSREKREARKMELFSRGFPVLFPKVGERNQQAPQA